MSFLRTDLSNFKEADRVIVERYLSDLKGIIPVYYKIIQEIDVDEHELEVFELLNMRSQLYIDNHYHFSKALEYALQERDVYSVDFISLELLIDEGLLPDYCISLSKPCLYLLIHAIDHALSSHCELRAFDN